MRILQIAALACLLAVAAASISAKDNFRPVSITVDQAPFDILATPITPDAPYSQKEYQCNVTGDSRYPPYAFGTFPLKISVPIGKRVRVIFANGNLNGDTTTIAGEPGVIVQQGGAPIVQQAGGASPIVQRLGAPVVQQQNVPPAALIVQQTPTVVQQPTWPAAPSVPAGPIIDQGGNTPAPTTTPVPTQTPQPTTSPTPVPTKAPANNSSPPAPAAPPAVPPQAALSPPTTQSPPPTANVSSPHFPPAQAKATPTALALPQLPPMGSENISTPAPPVLPPTHSTAGGRKLLQDTVPGGPNNGLVEYVALANASSVPGFYAGSTQFGVPYIEFTATEAAKGQIASFQGVLEVAQVVGGVPLYPFRPNPSLSPECQINVDFRVAQ